ncbi:MAG: crossover junction endodeoxyribonuclease RuvC [Oscillospiraceae bacterium]|jgi:crossover junction endodeoxyribonuclease RuvC|nr:crossover junction endodeoxyribonuclease RuvC [Oscillospiraceae bacterium]
MRIIGIDPGYAIVGYGVTDYAAGRFKAIDYGAITTKPDMSFDRRLEEIHLDLGTILDEYKPEYMALEKIFFTTNQKTAIDVAQARGVIILTAKTRSIKIIEYTPLQVKSAVTGYGKATKKQIQEMTARILSLDTIPKPDDAADALAVAICLAHSYKSQLNARP